MATGPETLRTSTPGRICLFGEHQDYLQLPVIAAAISRRISIHGTARPDDTMVLDLPDVGTSVSFSIAGELHYAEERDYFRSGVNVLRRHGHHFSRGYDCVVRGNIPINAGTSSSSALVVGWIHFLSCISDHRAPLAREEIANLAYEAEVLEFSEPGGMMDHYATALGKLIFLEPHPRVKVLELDAPLGTFVLGNSHQTKDTKGILARVRAEVTDVVSAIRRTCPDFSLHTATREGLRQCRTHLDRRQRAILEATLVNRDTTYQGLATLGAERLDHDRLGQLLNEQQVILRDTLQISTPKIDAMIETALRAGACGAKINGSGGGGCMFAYAPEHADEVADAVNGLGEAMVVSLDRGTHEERQAAGNA